MVEELKRNNFKVIGTDIKTGVDFLWEEPASQYDCIITNPPYSIKQQFLERVYNLGKPFAFLLPLTALETPSRQRLYEEFGLEIILLNKRINFIKLGVGNGAWAATAWFTNGLNLGKQLIFEKIR